jgi:hypothetical protein
MNFFCKDHKNVFEGKTFQNNLSFFSLVTGLLLKSQNNELKFQSCFGEEK